MAPGIRISWITVLLMLSRILDMVELQGYLLEDQGIKMSILIS
jgi:hypothetical protein